MPLQPNTQAVKDLQFAQLGLVISTWLLRGGGGWFEKGLACAYGILSVERSTDERTVGVVIGLSARGLHGFQGGVFDEIGEPGVLETLLLYVVGDCFEDEVVGRRGHADTKVITL